MNNTYFHTSPREIKEINSWGALGEVLCFSSTVYCMSAAENVIVYTIELDESEIVEVCELDCEESAQEIAALLSISEDDAARVLDGRDSALLDHGADAEQDLAVQGIQGLAAKRMGYRAAVGNDEQGAVYLVPMRGRESELRVA